MALKDHIVKLKFVSFNRQQFGRGWVAFNQSEAESAMGRYDPHVLFIHDDAESYDKEVEAQVEQDCKELQRLLNKFSIAKEFLSTKAISCQIQVDPVS